MDASTADPAGSGETPEPPTTRTRGRRARTWALHALGLLAVVVVGSALGSALAPAVTTQVGPLEAEVRVRPSLDPGVKVLLPPAGEVVFATHWTPVAVEARIATVDLPSAQRLLASPADLEALESTAPEVLRRAAIGAALWSAGCSFLGAAVLSVLVFRTRWWHIGTVSTTVAGLLVALTATTALTFAPDRFAQPQFSGLLSQAPYLATQTGSLVQRLQGYRAGVGSIVQAVTTLYAMSGQLPVVGKGPDEVVTVLHVSDLHLSPLGFDLTQRLVRDFRPDLVVDTGDITTWGSETEASSLSWIGRLGVPYVFVRGNHDSTRTERVVAGYPNAVVLTDGVAEVKGITIAGIADPIFTPSGAVTLSQPRPTPSRAGPSRAGPSGAGPAGSGPAGAGPAGAAPSVTLGAADVAPPSDPELAAGYQLAGTIEDWNAAHPDRPVTIAAVHQPYAVPPLLGQTPLVLTGHFHSRDVRADPSGTLVMRQGSTGGAGISADFRAVLEGKPVPLSASLLYIARSGPRAGQVLAYDEVTVGGFGFASATVQRTVLREDQRVEPGEPEPSPGSSVTPSSGSSSGSSAPSVTPQR